MVCAKLVAKVLDDMLDVVWVRAIGGHVCRYPDASFERRLENVHFIQKENDVGACKQGARTDLFP
jgi:hypothetical protein